MLISYWSSDVCSSDLIQAAKIKSALRCARAPHPPPAFAGAGSSGTFSREREKGWLRYSAPILLIGAALLPPPILDPTPPPGSSLTRTAARPDTAEDALRRELYLFALYRTLEEIGRAHV